ncbi:Mannose-6-phosphate isomerase, class I [Cnuella takakiae]|uniref:Mannose-6-phosphate isomerase, class I n=1 Tax=Cnuella takakiae TaxID=1302690 RepID=A0A1M5CI94_9BACT|nr:class I mannose-6-phosphate isomerase [Cnuella takakiae]OLY91831.1 hypothetical protein BUE76_07900 [Cnuella takakiae]SHF54317.1 Mannose-6-phosphate isomerase, class I [Cnuella takakiae]
MNNDLTSTNTDRKMKPAAPQLRKTAQYLMPVQLTNNELKDSAYDIYPFHSVGDHKIFNGYDALAQWICGQKTVLIDGYVGVYWDKVQAALQHCFDTAGLSVKWVQTDDFLKAPAVIEALVQPYLGTYDSVWGSKCSLSLADLYDQQGFKEATPEGEYNINIVIGTGAALCGWKAPLIYIDLPKNEIQFRMRAGSIYNLGSNEVNEPFYSYKRCYFVDWVLANNHKKALLNRIAVIADGQWLDDINWMHWSTLMEGLDKISKSLFRVRPWFEPGAWGGQWIKNKIPGLNKDVVNYAWSFELIVPENGLVFESSGYLLEVSFDFLMFAGNEAVLGRHAATFGDEFPIRFDFLDTFDGGNLSIQCHPSRQYIQSQFGEIITQDETYYILDCQEDAQVYLGFQEHIDADEFYTALQASQEEGIELDIETFVQKHPAQKHDLFLIPNQTVHSAGAGNLVLEISATPYIFTFKMYDWLRLDLDGKPRPINLEHAFNNLDFSRKGDRVKQELLSKPYVLEQGADYQLVHLPTHAEHFYDVHRIEFSGSVNIDTEDRCHVLMLVEGSAVAVQTADGTAQQFAYAETFVIPAAAQSYQLVNRGKGLAKVIKAFLK